MTAGPTREFLDPVRFLSNPSTGKMGFAVARAARAAGHEVTLIAGPVSLKTPPGVTRIDVVSARDMLNAVRTVIARADVLVMTAAVADWRPAHCASRKLKKTEMSDTLHLVRNPDILNASRRRRIAQGAGVTVQQVNLLVKQYEQARDMMKQVMNSKGKNLRGLMKGLR